MSEIKAGDMVRIVWGCCKTARSFIGRIYTVDYDVPNPYGSECVRCGIQYFGRVVHFAGEPHGLGIQISSIIKIEPPGESESTETGEELTA